MLTFYLRRSLTDVRPVLLLWLALGLAIASHGALDSLTTYGEGIQFLAPFTEARYWSPWRPLGGGIVRDSLAFVLFYGVSRTVMVRRGMELPRCLNPRFLRAAVYQAFLPAGGRGSRHGGRRQVEQVEAPPVHSPAACMIRLQLKAIRSTA